MEYKLEKLSTAYDALTRAGDFLTTSDPRGWIKASNRLLDCAIDCGMDRDEDDHEAWAAERITRWMVAA